MGYLMHACSAGLSETEPQLVVHPRAELRPGRYLSPARWSYGIFESLVGAVVWDKMSKSFVKSFGVHGPLLRDLDL